jgi:hypothetical protein
MAKKITLGGIFSWIFGILFLFTGMAILSEGSYVSGILVILCSAMIIPYFNQVTSENFNFQISGGIKFALVIAIFILVGISGFGEVNSNTNVQPTDNLVNEQKINVNNNPSVVEKTEVSTTKEETTEPQSYGLGDKVTIGNFAYTFQDYETSNEIGGSQYFEGQVPDGIFLIFDVTIENIAKESKTIWGSNVIVVDDQDRRFEHDTMAEIYLDDSFSFEQMQPGLPKKGKIVFDVPKDISGYIEVSNDNMWADEVKHISWAE